jgi:hypothetical protein
VSKAARRDPLAIVMALARKDPKFFHDLVFSPKKALSKLTALDRATRSRLAKVKAGVVLAGLPGLAADCGNDQTCSGATCDNTCAESCNGVTCGGGSCQSTCENSCDDTVSPPERLRGRRAELIGGRWSRVGVRARGAKRTIASRRARARR